MITEKLIQDCKRQKRPAQRQMYELLAPALYNVCRRYLRQEPDIEDTLSETFFIIFTKIDQLKDGMAMEAWARQIAVRNCLACIRKQVYFHDVEGNGDEEPSVPACETRSLEAKDLLNLVDQLPDGCRIVFTLNAIEGYTHREIAQMLHITEGTSKSQLNYARNKLRAFVNQFYYYKER